MNICKNLCTPNEYVCKSCGRTTEEQTYWNDIPEPVQQAIARRISAEQHIEERLLLQTAEIIRLNSIIKEMTRGNPICLSS